MIIKNNKTVSSVMKGNQIIAKIIKAGQTIYENFKNLIVSGIPPLTLSKSKGDNLIDYKIYGESVQDGTPTPDTPIEIESIGERTKNLVNWDLILESKHISKIENGYYSENYAVNGENAIVEHLKNVLKPNVTYTLSRIYTGTVNASNGLITIRNSNGSVISVSAGEGLKSKTFSLTQEEIDSINYVYLYFNTEGATITNLMLEEGDIVTNYEPYGYKIPVRARGENLIDYKKAYSSYGTFSFIDNGFEYVGKWMIHIPVSLEIGKYYTFSSDITGYLEGSTYPYWVIHYTDGTFSNATKLGYYVLCEKEMDRISLYVSNATEVTSIITNIQLEEGKVTTEYEPYVEPVTTNIYLDEPLRKVGDYADYIDFESGKVIRNINLYEINSNSSLKKFSGVTDYSTFFIDYDDLISSNVLTNFLVLSSKFQYNKCGTANMNSHWSANYQIGTSVSSTYKRICFTLPNIITSVESAKEWLNDNPIDCYYPVETPIEETIELPNIPTHKGTTVIEVDTSILPSNMEVTYKGK